MNFTKQLMVEPGTKAKLAKIDPGDTFGYEQDAKTDARLAKTLKRLDELQYMLYAEDKRAVLVVLQALDAGGKDGTIRHVVSGVNPQGCRVTAFKVPSAEELAHDFLWRAHLAAPARGTIGIFNRSHYEDVLVVRVHDLVPKHVWKERYDQINAFEKILAENRVKILKFYLHISKDEQKQRIEERIADPKKNWKLSSSDFSERKRWDDYMDAYEDALTRCSTSDAPWFAIPSNHKWFRNLAVSSIIVEAMEEMDLQFPRPTITAPKRFA
jgi:PPK2 family polyphosphate:nucleotide phosphotransferase